MGGRGPLAPVTLAIWVSMASPGAHHGLVSQSLDTLPWLVLDNLCKHLSQHDDDKVCRSLASFALTSRRCAAVSASYRFRRVVLQPEGSEDLVKIINAAQSFLGQDRLRYVREEIVDGFVAPYKGVRNQSIDDHDAEEGLDGELTWPVHRGFKQNWIIPPIQDELESETLRVLDQQWVPLIRFIQCLPGLQMLRWANSTDVPPSIVQALERRIPMVKLRVDAFELQGLHSPQGSSEGPGCGMSPEDYALALSQSLYAVNIPYYFNYGWNGGWDYHKEGLVEMVKTGNLDGQRVRHVAVTSVMPGATIELSRTFSGSGPTPATRHEWAGLRSPSSVSSQTPIPQQQGHLESLVLFGYGHSLQDLEDWRCCTDFSTLAKLELQWASLEVLQLLEDMAGNDNFASLDSLHLTVDNLAPSPDELTHTLGRLIRALRPLQHLKLTDSFEEGSHLLDDILERHGPRLRSLYLTPGEGLRTQATLGLQQFERLSSTCRRLQRLTLVIPRSQGSPDVRASHICRPRTPTTPRDGFDPPRMLVALRMGS